MFTSLGGLKATELRKLKPAAAHKKSWWAIWTVAMILAASGCGTSDDLSGTAPEATTQDSISGERAAEDEALDEEPVEESEPEMTSGQENALRSAESYIEMSGFSKAGLIEQLSSPAGEGYSKADAKFAANHVDANWKEEAVESAESYMEMSPMSKDALIEQLSSPAGEEFTLAQARYAADKVY